MIKMDCRIGLFRKWCGFVFIVLISMFSVRAHALASLILESMSTGYSSCSWTDNGDGTSTLGLTISFKEAKGHTAGNIFRTRGLLVYTYKEGGVLNPSEKIVHVATMNGERALSNYTGTQYVMYHHWQSSFKTPWENEEPMVAYVTVKISNSTITDWPAIGIRAGNYTTGDDVGEISGVAYIRQGENQGNCSIVVDPGVPPPLEISIKMTAPDWNLGDLQRGESEKTFTDAANQLCFTYSGSAVNGKRFVINAGSANGVVSNRYRLKNVDGASQFIPYSITLNGGTSPLSLPNTSSVPVPLNSSGKTCFVPTFKTTVDDNVKDGDYNDVLTFTVVTKP
ncbi:hypothetical protein [Burkholderia sp. JKS000303]|uniref:hypothetical protein n=1 Tax=Burkholderia sp. JKS000303 TaxID=1938747 RepID=UPI000C019295|nr:hypothetical protein [Burkholderia sp. JKS000303]PFH19509.1 hypothetical protein BX604_6112 [Burkholderia sp. JKS000303]